MTHGPGKYDDLCMHALVQANADAAVVMVFGGDRGSGFSVSVDVTKGAVLMARMPALLRSMANQIEADTKPAGSA